MGLFVLHPNGAMSKIVLVSDGDSPAEVLINGISRWRMHCQFIIKKKEKNMDTVGDGAGVSGVKW